MPAIVSAWRAAREQLEAAGVDSPVIDARLLLESALGASRAEIIADPRRDLSGEETARYEALVARRVAREPVSRILGRKGFWKIDLEVTPDVLTPRPETETLLDVMLPRLPPDAQILDFGVGSGAILLALLAERRDAWGVGLDISPSALAVARRNAETLGLQSTLVVRPGRLGRGDRPGERRCRRRQSAVHRDGRPRDSPARGARS